MQNAVVSFIKPVITEEAQLISFFIFCLL